MVLNFTVILLLSLSLAGVLLLPSALQVRRARKEGLELHFIELLYLRLRGVDVETLLATWISLHAAGLAVEFEELETHASAAGDVKMLSEVLLQAWNNNIAVTYHELATVDLRGEDLIEYLRHKC